MIVGKQTRTAVAIFAVILVALEITSVVASHQQIRKVERLLEDSMAWRERRDLVNSVELSVLRMQASRRGFVLTRDETFAQQLAISANETKRQINELVARFQPEDFPRRHASLADQMARIKVLVDEYWEQLSLSVAEYRSRPDATAQRSSTLDGQVQSETIQLRLNALEANIEAAQEYDLRQLVGTAELLENINILLEVLIILALAAGYWFLRREILHRQGAQAELARLNEELEQVVAIRTQAIAAAANRQQQFLELSTEAIISCDESKHVTYMNAAAKNLFADREPLQSDPLLEHLLGGEEHSGEYNWLDALWSKPSRLPFRASQVLTSQGTYSPVQLSGMSFRDATGIQVQLVVRDVSRQIANEQLLKEQLRFIDQLIDAIPMPLSVRDERGRYLRTNRAYESIYECNRNEIRQRSVFDVLDPDRAKRVSDYDSRTIDSSTSIVYPSAVNKPGQPTSHYLTRSFAMRREDRSVIGVVAVDTDVTELRGKEAELMETNRELEALSQKLIRSQEDERRRIARDLHDQVGQILTALKMSLEMLALQDSVGPSELAKTTLLANEALSQTRTLTTSLHPHILEDLGLVPAVRWLAEHYVEPLSLAVEIETNVVPERANPAHELVAFRTVQEALTNILRHAQASSVKVRLSCDQHELHISIADDGEGFLIGAAAADPNHVASLGLASMRERVAEVGGVLHIKSSPGQGTEVLARIPW